MLVFFFGFASFAQAPAGEKEKPHTIQKITVLTENKKLQKSISRQLKSYITKSFSQKQINNISEDLEVFLKKRKILLPNFSPPELSITEKKVSIVYKINNPYRYGWVLSGNKSIDKIHLISKDTYNRFFNDPQLVRKTLFTIKEFYLSKGFANVQMSSKVKTNKKDFIKTVYIAVKEGSKIKIKDIKLSGQFSKNPKYYKSFIKKYSGALVKKNFFYNEGLQKGFKNLLNYLKNQGRLSAEGYLKSTPVGSSKMNIEITLLEGPLNFVKDIVFTGNKYFSNEQLLKIIKTRPRSALNINSIEQDRQTIINTYKKEGFIEMTLNKTEDLIQYDEKTNSAVLNFNISENDKIQIADIIIRNNEITKASFILKNIPVKKGGILTTKNIDLTLRKLRNLGIFSSINIMTEPAEGEPGLRYLIIQVKERKARSLRMAAGLNTERTLTARGFIEFSSKNIAGTGRQFFSHLKLQSNIARYLEIKSTHPNYLERQVSASWFEPFFLGTGFNGQVQLSNSSQIFSYQRIQDSGLTNIADTSKINLLLQRKINTFINLNWILISLERRKEIEYGQTSCQNQPDQCSNTPFLNIGSTGLIFNIDKRNSLLAASDGFLSKILAEYVWPINKKTSLNKMSFVKMEIKHFDFRPIYKKLIWVNSFQGGLIWGTGGRPEHLKFPVSRGFILGGINSLRGFDGLINGERVPDKQELPIQGANELISGRHSLYFLLKSECRFPISGNLLGTVFYDGGMVGIQGKKFNKPYRHSAGVGLRYKTPLGPVAGYIAFKIDPKKHESRLLPHLSFGDF